MFQKTIESVQVEFNHAHLLFATFDFKKLNDGEFNF